MTQTTVESIFGTKAGVIWRALNQNGPNNITNLIKITSMSREEILGALGWLGREDKIVIEQKGREMIFSLRESEVRLQAPPETAMEDYAPKARSKPKLSKRKIPKKAGKAKTARASAKQDDSQARESDRTEDFLLH